MKIDEIFEIISEKSGRKAKAQLSNPEATIGELLTDSRNFFSPDDSLFFAIRNSHGHDGHDFIPDLYKRGIKNFIVEEECNFLKEKKDTNYIIVDNSIKALAAIGQSHRCNSEKVIAIVGSRGKTTLKEILFQLLEPLLKISRSPRSFNSKIGVPLSLWQIPPSTQLSLIEAGISCKGEMDFLAETIDPDIVIFTNIGEAHSEGFASLQEKAMEKARMLKASSVKKIIYPYDESLLRDIICENPDRKEIFSWSFTSPNATVFLKVKPSQREEGVKTIEYIWQNTRHSISFNAETDYDLENAASALTFMLSAGIHPDIIEERFSSLHSISTRMNVSEGVNGCTIITDSYTSDYSSLLPAIDFMRRRKMPSQDLTLIMSDIRHETVNPQETYERIAILVRNSGIHKFIGIGDELSGHAHLFPENSIFFKDTDEFLSKISASDFVDTLILLKGAPEFGFKEISRQLEARKHETVLHVNLDAMIRNYNYFRTFLPPSTGIVAMVKAFGYGVGSFEIAKTLQDCGASYLAVAVLDEGIELRRRGIVMPIIVMNPRAINYKALFEYKLQPVIYSSQMLYEMIGESKKNGIREYPVHIKIDTGMHRMGFMHNEISELISIIKTTDTLKIESVFSHLATADCLDMDAFTFRQLDLFEKISTRIINDLPYHAKRHILNSAGIIRFPEYHYDLVRLGIGLYGANTLPPTLEKPLSTVASLETTIICIREIDEGEAVGYSRKGVAEVKSRIATLPLGYADGIDRRLGNGNLQVLVKGHTAPTIGNICMDAMMIDVTGIECEEGDTVEVFGNNISLQQIADTLNTIPYEILTSVSLRVKRNYYRE